MGSASLQRKLRELSKAGLVCSERVGNVRRFQANPQSPVLGELVALTCESSMPRTESGILQNTKGSPA